MPVGVERVGHGRGRVLEHDKTEETWGLVERAAAAEEAEAEATWAAG